MQTRRFICLIVLLALLSAVGASLPAWAQVQSFAVERSPKPPPAGRFPGMPRFVGLGRAQASALAGKLGLVPRFAGATDPEARVGSQRPEPGIRIVAGMPILLQMQSSLPSPQGQVPKFIGLRRGDADSLARQSGLAPRFFGTTDADARVGNQRPEAGAPIFRTGMLIGLQMTAPPPQGQVPNFVGLARDEAIALARSRTLAPRVFGATGPNARVSSQQPIAGAPIDRVRMPIILQMEAPLPLPQRRVPNFVGLRRDQASTLAGKWELAPRFVGATDPDAQVDGQQPGFGSSISGPNMVVILRMEGLPLLGQVPNFVGLGRVEASDQAKQSDLSPEFAGATDRDAHVGSQRPKFGTPIFHTGMRIWLQMEAPPPAPVPPAPTGAGGTSTAGSSPTPVPPTPTGAGGTSTSGSSPTPLPPTPVPPTPVHPTPVQPTPTLGRSKTQTGAVTGETCNPRDLPSWLATSVRPEAVTTCPESAKRNWLLLLAAAVALAGGTFVLFRAGRVVNPRVNANPHMAPSARLATRTVSNGLAAMTVSLEPADGRHIDVRYVLKRDARPETDTTRITISGEGGTNDS